MFFLLSSALLVCLYSLSDSLNVESGPECRVVTSLAFSLRKNEWCCMVRFNTYLSYLNRFRVVWDVVTFSLLVPVIHTLWLNMLIFTGLNMVLKCPIRYNILLWIIVLSQWVRHYFNSFPPNILSCDSNIKLVKWFLCLKSVNAHFFSLSSDKKTHTQELFLITVFFVCVRLQISLSELSVGRTWKRNPTVTMETSPHLLLCSEGGRKRGEANFSGMCGYPWA